VLKANLRDAKDQELIFRTRCVAGLINWLVLAPVGDELRNKSQKQIERLLLPIVAGAFRAAAPGDSQSGSDLPAQQTIQADA
jgi:alkylation response protein AidB-like acyl-CoA dehydrogenase